MSELSLGVHLSQSWKLRLRRRAKRAAQHHTAMTEHSSPPPFQPLWLPVYSSEDSEMHRCLAWAQRLQGHSSSLAQRGRGGDETSRVRDEGAWSRWGWSKRCFCAVTQGQGNSRSKKNQVRVAPLFLCPSSDMTTGGRDLRSPSLPAVSPIHRGAGQGEGGWQGFCSRGEKSPMPDPGVPSRSPAGTWDLVWLDLQRSGKAVKVCSIDASRKPS